MLSTSSSYNVSLLNSEVFHKNPLFCLFTNPGQMIYSFFNVIHVILLLPLCSFILYLGFQQIKLKNSNPSVTPISHCDIFTYHLVLMELIGALASVISFFGNNIEKANIFMNSILIYTFTWYGQIFFHTVTCVERYLAVVHPITYLCLKNERGIQLRNICMVCIWLFCIGGSYAAKRQYYIYLDSFLLVSSTMVIIFCSVSVLCNLIRPGPGKQSRERTDQSKQKAFYNIVVILGILMIRLCFDLIWAALFLSGNTAQCLMISCAGYISLPSSLVLPVLFLQRKGKLKPICI